MLPLPESLYSQLSDLLRSINTWSSLAITRFSGAPVFREGYDVYLPSLHLVVNHSCSGIRYMLSFFTFSIVYAVFFRENIWSRFSIIAGSIPFSIIAGTIRLTVVFLAAYYISPFWAEHTPHVFLSWVVFAAFLFGFIIIDQYAFILTPV